MKTTISRYGRAMRAVKSVALLLTLITSFSATAAQSRIEDIEEIGDQVVITYKNGQTKTLSTQQFAAQEDREEKAFQRFLLSPSNETYSGLTIDQKLSQFEDGLKLKFRPEDLGTGRLVGRTRDEAAREQEQAHVALRFAFEKGEKTLAPQDQGEVVARQIQTLIFNGDRQDVIKRLYSFSTSIGGGSQKTQVLCEIAGEIFVENPTELNGQTATASMSGETEIRPSIVDENRKTAVTMAQQNISGFNKFLSSLPDQKAILNLDCPNLQNNIQNAIAAETSKLEALKAEVAISENRAGGKLTHRVSDPKNQPQLKSWCSEKEIRSLMGDAVTTIQQHPKAVHYFNSRLGGCVLAGTLTKNKSGQFVFNMRQSVGEGGPLALKFFHVNELVALVNSNQGPKPPETTARAQPTPAPLTVRASTAPATTVSDGAIWSPFGDTRIFRSTGAAK